jgi:predicted Zn-dependent protease
VPDEVEDGEREMVRLAGRAAQATFAVRVEEACRLFEELIARYPERRGVRLAYALLLSRDAPEKAMAQLRREAELFPDNPEAHLEIAFEILDRGDPREALEPAREAVRLAPDSHSSHVALGRALLATGSVDEAIVQLERAVRLAPEARESYVALAQAYARAGRTSDLERARKTLQELDARRGAGRSS